MPIEPAADALERFLIGDTGRPLVLLHGGLGSGEMFGPILPALSERHQVVVPDLQGHGRTGSGDQAASFEGQPEITTQS